MQIYGGNKKIIYIEWQSPLPGTATTSVLISLFRLTEVSNFCSNSLSPFLLMVHILSSQAISFQIFFNHSSTISFSTLIPFPSYFNFHNLMYLGTNIFTHDMIIPSQTALNYHIARSSTLHSPYPKEHQSTPYKPVSPHTSS